MLALQPGKTNVIQQTRLLTEKELYFNTDSIIYVDDGTKNVKTGDMLGEMTDELSGKGITDFVSTGPKSYSFKYGDNEQKSTIKSSTLNHENISLLNHDSLSKIVEKKIREITIVNENKITRKNREIVNKYCEKYSNLAMTKELSNKSMKTISTHCLMVTKCQKVTYFPKILVSSWVGEHILLFLGSFKM